MILLLFFVILRRKIMVINTWIPIKSNKSLDQFMAQNYTSECKNGSQINKMKEFHIHASLFYDATLCL